ncbi:hypothetical protein PV10_08200 [Exophiala mesophila]|uniref:Zn(2)-C6 fungal-type domain-containing protein n=1 Tax=Exophiala mesophila TaxID=212818 RepID=A0A0D1Z1A1_EXOME|nr:uncharacterized protein PV10_08200 [Exophiala mesophila]KIV88522.1 hypothetical protein PV10_08200 [Exophiala mesophila]
MPNVGRPSRDCHLCRQRRVKCDLLRPECGKCVRLGRKCPGYRKERDMLFKVENANTFVKNATRDRRRRPEKPVLEPVSELATSENALVARPDDINTVKASNLDEIIRILMGYCPAPSNGLPENWDNHTVPFFLRKFCTPRVFPRPRGFLGFLPAMVSSAPPQSSLVSTCKAIAYALFAHHLRTPDAQSRRAIAYGDALIATNQALQDQRERLRDETLTAIWLLSIYEIMVGSVAMHQEGGAVGWEAHLKGIITLLRLRTTNCLKTPTERNLFFVIYNTIQIQSFASGIPCPPESIAWFAELENNIWPDELYSLQVCRYGYEASVTCAKIREILNSRQTVSLPDIVELLLESESLDLKSAYLLSPGLPVPFPESGGNKEGQICVVTDLRTLTTRTFFCAFRLKLHLSRLQLLQDPRISQLEPTGFQNTCRQLVSTVQEVADEILSVKSVLFSTQAHKLKPFNVEAVTKSRQWTDGIRVLWPLKMVAACKFMRAEQRANAVLTLQFIRDGLSLQEAGDLHMD